MHKSLMLKLFLVLWSVGASNFIFSQEKIDNLKFGEYWYGKKISHKDLEGKVVLFEMWGT